MIVRLLSAVSLALCCLSAPLQAADDGTRHLTTGDNFPPYTGADLPKGGLATAIVTETFAKAGIRVELDYKPWKRGYEEAKRTTYLGTFPYVKSPDRLEDFHYSDPIFTFERTLFERKHPVDSQWPGRMTGNRVCIPIGYEVPKTIEDMVIDGRLTHINPSSMKACFKQLFHNRTDYVLSDRILGLSIATRFFGTGLQHLQAVAPAVTEQTAHLIVSKRHPDGAQTLAAFNAALQALRKDGTIDRLIAEQVKR